jgi:hypothetical protein
MDQSPRTQTHRKINTSSINKQNAVHICQMTSGEINKASSQPLLEEFIKKLKTN